MSNQTNDDGSELTLSEADACSAVWKRIEAHLEARLALLRKKNDAVMSHEETLSLRGRISEIKKMLAAGADRD